MQVNPYPFKSAEWYQWTHEEAQHCHDVFMQWKNSHPELRRVLEVGCGAFPYYEKYFEEYDGLDIDDGVIAHRRKSVIPDEHYHCADILTWDGPEFDFVFSRAVIDHMEDPDAFIVACLRHAKMAGWVYIMNYRGWFDGLPSHRSERGPDGTWYTDVSMWQIEELAVHENFEVQFLKVNTGRQPPEITEETHIIIQKH